MGDLAPSCTHPGAQDGSVKVWDTRMLRSPDDALKTLRTHTDAIIRLEWNPHCKVCACRMQIDTHYTHTHKYLMWTVY